MSLTVKRSINWRSAVAGLSLGNSLVFTNDSEPNDEDNIRFIMFNGTLLRLTDEELKVRPVSEYLLYIRAGEYLDCKVQAKAGTCKASMSNCCRRLVHISGANIKAVPNCRLVNYPQGSNNLWLALIAKVKRNDDVLWDYGPEFKIPTEVKLKLKL